MNGDHYPGWADENAGFPEPEIPVDRTLRARIWWAVIFLWAGVAVLAWSLA